MYLYIHTHTHTHSIHCIYTHIQFTKHCDISVAYCIFSRNTYYYYYYNYTINTLVTVTILNVFINLRESNRKYKAAIHHDSLCLIFIACRYLPLKTIIFCIKLWDRYLENVQKIKNFKQSILGYKKWSYLLV